MGQKVSFARALRIDAIHSSDDRDWQRGMALRHDVFHMVVLVHMHFCGRVWTSWDQALLFPTTAIPFNRLAQILMQHHQETSLLRFLNAQLTRSTLGSQHSSLSPLKEHSNPFSRPSFVSTQPHPQRYYPDIQDASQSHQTCYRRTR